MKTQTQTLLLPNGGILQLHKWFWISEPSGEVLLSWGLMCMIGGVHMS